MSLVSKLALGCVLGLSTISVVAPANAMPFAPLSMPERNRDVTGIRVVCGHGGCNQAWSPGYYRRPYYRPAYNSYVRPYRPYNYYRPYYGGSSAYIGLGFAPYYTGYYGGYYGSYYPYYANRAYYPPPYYAPRTVYRAAVTSRHQQWCMARYRSYNPASNRFLSYSGVYKLCRSPWY